MSFNVAQLATIEQARALVSTLAQYGMTVKPEVADQAESGIYVPLWSDFGGPIPADGDAKWYHFRFTNGAEGINVGLIQDRLKRYPNSPGYVLRSLAEEVSRIAEGA